MWTQEEAIRLATTIEKIAPQYGAHIALTGGLLYKQGPRKDCDFLFYRIRQVESIQVDPLFAALKKIGVVKVGGWGWCHKATYKGKNIDFFFPEEPSGPQYNNSTFDMLETAP